MTVFALVAVATVVVVAVAAVVVVADAAVVVVVVAHRNALDAADLRTFSVASGSPIFFRATDIFSAIHFCVDCGSGTTETTTGAEVSACKKNLEVFISGHRHISLNEFFIKFFGSF